MMKRRFIPRNTFTETAAWIFAIGVGLVILQVLSR